MTRNHQIRRSALGVSPNPWNPPTWSHDSTALTRQPLTHSTLSFKSPFSAQSRAPQLVYIIINRPRDLRTNELGISSARNPISPIRPPKSHHPRPQTSPPYPPILNQNDYQLSVTEAEDSDPFTAGQSTSNHRCYHTSKAN